MRYRVMSRPAMSSLRVRWGKEKPSYTGQMWVTPSPESTTTPVSKPIHANETLQWSMDPSLISKNVDKSRAGTMICLTLSVQSEHGLNGHIDAVELVLLKHDLRNLLPVLGGVHGRLSQQDLGRVKMIHSCVEALCFMSAPLCVQLYFERLKLCLPSTFQFCTLHSDGLRSRRSGPKV